MKLAEQILATTENDSVSMKKGSIQTSIGGECPHYHHYRVDRMGGGTTTFTSENCENHFHNIVDYKVQPASDGHIHLLDQSEEEKKYSADTIPNFKSLYGLIHWIEKEEKSRNNYSGSVIVNGKPYKSIKDAANQLWKEKNAIRKFNSQN